MSKSTQEIINEIREIINYNIIPMVHDQINVLLNQLSYARLLDTHGNKIHVGDRVEYTRTIYSDCNRSKVEKRLETITGVIYYAEGLWLGIQRKDGTGYLFRPGELSVDDVNEDIEVIEEVIS